MTTMSRPALVGPSTWEDFIALDEDDPRELIDGHLLEIDVATELHEYIVFVLGHLLVDWTLRNGGRVLGSAYKIRVTERRGVMPDVQYYARGRPANPPAGLERGAPDLGVEVVSPSSRRYDRVTKLAWYASIGMPEYWIVDSEARTIERLVLRDGAYAIVHVADEGTFEPESFPGLSIPLDRLFTIPD